MKKVAIYPSVMCCKPWELREDIEYAFEKQGAGGLGRAFGQRGAGGKAEGREKQEQGAGEPGAQGRECGHGRPPWGLARLETPRIVQRTSPVKKRAAPLKKGRGTAILGFTTSLSFRSKDHGFLLKHIL